MPAEGKFVVHVPPRQKQERARFFKDVKRMNFTEPCTVSLPWDAHELEYSISNASEWEKLEQWDCVQVNGTRYNSGDCIILTTAPDDLPNMPAPYYSHPGLRSGEHIAYILEIRAPDQPSLTPPKPRDEADPTRKIKSKENTRPKHSSKSNTNSDDKKEVRTCAADNAHVLVCFFHRPEDIQLAAGRPCARFPWQGRREILLGDWLQVYPAQLVSRSASVSIWKEHEDPVGVIRSDGLDVAMEDPFLQVLLRSARQAGRLPILDRGTISHFITEPKVPRAKAFTRMGVLNNFDCKIKRGQENFMLEPKKYCICQQPHNPDLTLIQCRHCGEYLHARCLAADFVRRVRISRFGFGEQATPANGAKKGRGRKKSQTATSPGSSSSLWWRNPVLSFDPFEEPSQTTKPGRKPKRGRPPTKAVDPHPNLPSSPSTPVPSELSIVSRSSLLDIHDSESTQSNLMSNGDATPNSKVFPYLRHPRSDAIVEFESGGYLAAVYCDENDDVGTGHLSLPTLTASAPFSEIKWCAQRDGPTSSTRPEPVSESPIREKDKHPQPVWSPEKQTSRRSQTHSSVDFFSPSITAALLAKFSPTSRSTISDNSDLPVICPGIQPQENGNSSPKNPSSEPKDVKCLYTGCNGYYHGSGLVWRVVMIDYMDDNGVVNMPSLEWYRSKLYSRAPMPPTTGLRLGSGPDSADPILLPSPSSGPETDEPGPGLASPDVGADKSKRKRHLLELSDNEANGDAGGSSRKKRRRTNNAVAESSWFPGVPAQEASTRYRNRAEFSDDTHSVLRDIQPSIAGPKDAKNGVAALFPSISRDWLTVGCLTCMVCNHQFS